MYHLSVYHSGERGEEEERKGENPYRKKGNTTRKAFASREELSGGWKLQVIT